ncbi:MAG: hypothetical protein EXR86_11415 [Gammaproteobacteria bacterium]|nr:hypothetical protein [Gammaproteobacteria bacterium]
MASSPRLVVFIVTNMALDYLKTKSLRSTAYGIPVGFLEVRGIVNATESARLAAEIRTFLGDLLATSSLDAVLADPRLTGYQALHARIGKTGRQFVPSPESQFKFLFKRREWRATRVLIDCYSLVSMQTRVSIGAHDLAQLTLPLALEQMQGDDTVTLIGETVPTRVTSGEYCYRDAAGRLLGRLECRQAAHSRITEATRDVLFIVQGHATLGAPEIIATVEALLSALTLYCGGWASATLTLAE